MLYLIKARATCTVIVGVLLWISYDHKVQTFSLSSSTTTSITFTINTTMSDNRKRPASNQVVDLLSSSDDDSDCEIINQPPVAAKTKKEPKRQKAHENSKRSPLEPVNAKAVSTCMISTNSNNDDTKTMAARSEQPPKGSVAFNVATYNVWFGPPHQEERMNHLVRSLMEKNEAHCPLWFIGMQEVTPVLLATLKPLLEANGYYVFSQGDANYGCAMAVLQKSSSGAAVPKLLEKGWRHYEKSIMNRGFLYARVRLPKSSQQIVFTTTHLESYAGEIAPGQKYTGSPERALQLPELETFCLNKSKQFQDFSLSIMSGDLNWDDERIQSQGEDKEMLSCLSMKDWQDSWVEVKGREMEKLKAVSKNGKVAKKNVPACYTYDAKENPMLGGNLRRRFDRILIRPKSEVQLQIKGIDLIGKDAIPGLTWRKESVWQGRVTSVKDVPVAPSDHFGYVATLQIK